MSAANRPFTSFMHSLYAPRDFPIETRMEWYRREMRRGGADVWFETMGCGALTEGNKVTGVGAPW